MMDAKTHTRQFTKPECENLLRLCGYDGRAPADYEAIIRLYEAIGKNGRGFALRGINGVGKTMAATALVRNGLFEEERTRAFSMCNQGNAELLATLSGVMDYTAPPNGVWVLVDDVGVEEIISDYGVRYEAFAKAVQRIYGIRRNGTGIRLAFTTNLTEDDIERRYGVHVADRIDELVVWLAMDGRGFSERKRMEIKKQDFIQRH